MYAEKESMAISCIRAKIQQGGTKMKKKIALMLALVMCLGGCGIEEIKDTFSEKVDEKLEQRAAEKTKYTQEQVCEEVYRELAAGKKKISFDGLVSMEMAQYAVNHVMYDCPEVFWTNNMTISTDYKSTTLECDSINDLDESELALMAEKLDIAAEEVAAEAEKGGSDYEKIMLLHDKLIEICDYDYEAYEQTEVEKMGFAGSSYGCLVEHEAVCEGFAQAFSLVGRKMGFDCGIVSGIAGGETHAWNYIKADGEYYWLDVTWDENTTETETDYFPMHKFFMLNDDLFMSGRTVDEDVPFVPQCTSMEDNYYVHSGLYLESYDFEAVDSIMSAHADEGSVDMMFADHSAYEAALNDLVEENNIWNLQVMQGLTEGKPYYSDDKLNTLMFAW